MCPCLLWLSLASVPVRRWCSDWNRREGLNPSWRSVVSYLFSTRTFSTSSSFPLQFLLLPDFFLVLLIRRPDERLARSHSKEGSLQHFLPLQRNTKAIGFFPSASALFYFSAYPANISFMTLLSSVARRLFRWYITTKKRCHGMKGGKRGKKREACVIINTK